MLSRSDPKPDESPEEPLTYRAAGVDIDAGEELVRRIKGHLASTFTPSVLDRYGGFAGFYRFGIDADVFHRTRRRPVLLAAADGVGTKLKIAFRTGVHDTVGVDMVAMCVNDLLVYGARPLFVLDYLACSSLETGVAERVISGVAEGCRQAGCALLGGETAELPGFYRRGEYDLAGFAVGVVEEDEILDGRWMEPGDAIVGLASSGLHSNGYSLARKVFLSRARWSLKRYVLQFGRTLGEELLEPTRIYVKPVLALLARYVQHAIRAMAHVTGGGIGGNLARVMPRGLGAVIRKDSWEVPPVFRQIARIGRVPEDEMYRVFNMGVGFLLVIGRRHLNPVVRHFRRHRVEAFEIGHVEPSDVPVRLV